MKFEKAFCPSCGAPIVFPEGKDVCFCSHCGHQIFLTDEQLEMKLKYRDNQEKREALSDLFFEIALVLSFIVIAVMLIVFMITIK